MHKKHSFLRGVITLLNRIKPPTAPTHSPLQENNNNKQTKKQNKNMRAEILCNNSNSSSFQFIAIWLAGENVLHFVKFHEQESRNYFPATRS